MSPALRKLIDALPKDSVILTHELVVIFHQPGTGYRVIITMQKGGAVEHNPFPDNQMGLVGAMQIATEVLAGKIWLMNSAFNGPGWVAPLAVQLEAPRKN